MEDTKFARWPRSVADRLCLRSGGRGTVPVPDAVEEYTAARRRRLPSVLPDWTASDSPAREETVISLERTRIPGPGSTTLADTAHTGNYTQLTSAPPPPHPSAPTKLYSAHASHHPPHHAWHPARPDPSTNRATANTHARPRTSCTYAGESRTATTQYGGRARRHCLRGARATAKGGRLYRAL